jgi:hypothetical protein
MRLDAGHDAGVGGLPHFWAVNSLTSGRGGQAPFLVVAAGIRYRYQIVTINRPGLFEHYGYQIGGLARAADPP